MSVDAKPVQTAIAVVGVSALFPGSSDAEGFWRDILQGRDLLTDVPSTHWRIEDYYDPDPAAPDKTYARRGGFLSPVDFDALGWGIPPATLAATDTAQLLALVVAQSVLQDAAGERFATMDRSRISVILGVTSAQELLFSMVSRLQRPVWVRALRESGLAESEVQAACDRIAAQYVPWQEASFPGLLGNVVAGRIANRLNLGGTNCVTDAACASTFSALSMAVNELQLGHSDLALAGGVDTLNDIFMYMCFSKTPALSPSGDCRPFSDQADGTMLGEGLGMVALKRLDDAERDGDRIYAVVRGIGTGSDGRAKSVYAPVASGQARALRRAYENAGYGADSVELMEAHGTGTKAGDAAEFEGLRTVFNEASETRRQWCALGSVKSQIGHTKAAAGAAGLFKAVMALHHKILPPTIKVSAPNPQLDINQSPFYLNTESRPWIRSGEHPRRASVSAFGFGGSNFHVALEEYVGTGLHAERLPIHSTDLVLLGADDGTSLIQKIDALHRATEPLALLAHRSRQQWDARPLASHRLALATADSTSLRTQLMHCRERITTNPEQAFELPDGSNYACGARSGGMAMLFPGQGSQYVGMGAALAMQFDAARQIWDGAAELTIESDQALHQIVFPIPVFDADARQHQVQTLQQTQYAQPAIGAHSAAVKSVLDALDIRADACGGHSFGEVMALHAAGVFDAKQAIDIASLRGIAMRDAAVRAQAGAMTAVAASVEEVQSLLNAHQGKLVIANHNAPRQVVVAGDTDAIAAFEASAQQAGISFKRLPVSTAFHAPQVADACPIFASALAEKKFSDATLPIYSNQQGHRFVADAKAQRQQLAAQIAAPVQFVAMIEAMYADGIRQFVEVGPNQILSGLVSAILGARPHQAIALDRKDRDGVATLLQGLARLAAAGTPLRASALYADVRLPKIEPTTGKLSIAISGSNLGKPYPPTATDTYPAPNPERAAVSDLPASTVVARPASSASSSPVSKPFLEPKLMPNSTEVQDQWLRVFQQTQQQTAAAHEAFQRNMTESHSAYLRLAESALLGLSTAPPPLVGAALAANAFASGSPSVAISRAGISSQSFATEVAPTERAVTADFQTSTQTVFAAEAAPTTGVGLEALLLEVVADKTGYPVDMLNLDMDMEGDLGIDSIKRVEILAAIDAREPNLPKVDRARLGALSTLREILNAYQPTIVGAALAANDFSVTSASVGSEAKSNHGNSFATEVAPTTTGGLEALLLEVVADKTGYPVDMLNLDMDMEGDLGIDSIKRVEILAAIDAREPNLPKVDRARLGALSTLREILNAYQPTIVGAALAANDFAMATASVGSEAKSNHSHSFATEVAPTEALATTARLGRFALERIAAAPTGFAQAGLLDGLPIYVLGEKAIAPLLADALRLRGVDAHAVDALPAGARGCVYLGGLNAPTDRRAAMNQNRAVFAVARTLAQKLQTESGLFVAVHDNEGGFGLDVVPALAPWRAGFPALIKTCALEWPLASVKSIDLQQHERSPNELARALADELLEGGGEMEVALPTRGGRFTLHSVRRSVLPTAPPMANGSVVVVSGGARGVTAACLKAWATRLPLKFVLLGRSELRDEPSVCADIDDASGLQRALIADAKLRSETLTPAQLSARVQQILAQREIRQTLAALHAAGSEAQYLSVAVTNSTLLENALEKVRKEWGPIRGLVHAAGVLADKRIADKTDAQFDQVFDTKVEGLAALLDATRADPLQLLCVFSSVSARCGNTGQADYAMANEVLAKIAQAEALRRPNLRVKSLGWGPWEGGMVTPSLKERFAALGVPMIPLSEGAAWFADEMADQGADGVELVLGAAPRAEALLFDGANARVDALDLLVHKDRHDWLQGHAVEGMPVVPVVLVAEWLARAACSLRPGLVLIALHDLKVLKGIRLDGFAEQGNRFRIEVQSLPHPDQILLQMRVRDHQGRLRYSARAEMHAEAASSEATNPKLDLPTWIGASPYAELLFHRDQFELIESMRGISDDGVSAQVRGVHAAQWPNQNWQLDVAALDGGLQLAVLYGQRMLGAPNLPTSIATLRAFAGKPGAGLITATAYRRHVAGSTTTTDIVFVNAQGERVAEMLGVENHALARA